MSTTTADNTNLSSDQSVIDSSLPILTQDLGESDKNGTKRSREDDEQGQEEEEQDSQAVSDQPVEEAQADYFVHWKYLTKEILKACSMWSDVIPVEGKCDVVYWNFDWNKFTELTGVAVDPIKQRLYTMSVWLRSPFGYSPYTSDKGQIQNNLRVTLGNYIQSTDKEFEEFCKVWDEFILETCLEKQSVWPILSMFTLKPGKKLDMDLLEQKYKWIVRPSKKPQYPPYIGYKFQTQREDKEKGIPEEDTTANVLVWNNQDKSAPVAEKLTEENIVPKKKEDRPKKKILLDRGNYVQNIFWFQKLFFTNDSFGPTLAIQEIIYDTEENLRKPKSGAKRVCRF